MKTDGKNLLLNTEMNFPESADKDRHLMRYTLLQEKNHHMAFLSQFWPLSDHSAILHVQLIFVVEFVLLRIDRYDIDN